MTIKISIHAPARGATPGTSDPSFLLIFQSTLPRGERPRHSISYRTRSYFNPRSREGSDFAFAMFYTSIFYFNPRSREGSDAVWVIISIKNTYFNPRSREGSDRNCGSRRGRLNYNFNPRSREGSDYSLGNTHALHVRFQSTLPRGERRYSAVLRVCCSLISIHAPARGATVIPGRLLAHVVGISIHAPARGATYLRAPVYHFHSNFNPRSREGSDGDKAKASLNKQAFQSTLPRGERRLWINHKFSLVQISIHAPARGATRTGYSLLSGSA